MYLPIVESDIFYRVLTFYTGRKYFPEPKYLFKFKVPTFYFCCLTFFTNACTVFLSSVLCPNARRRQLELPLRVEDFIKRLGMLRKHIRWNLAILFIGDLSPNRTKYSVQAMKPWNTCPGLNLIMTGILQNRVVNTKAKINCSKEALGCSRWMPTPHVMNI